ncbi:MAG: 50S ribosomal protein L22 [Planctomycetes bacterium]|nr:50S ribosomal protein L22 [Planctomycetota bacterium]
MLSAVKFRDIVEEKNIGVEQLASSLVHGSLKSGDAVALVNNWKKGLFKVKPSLKDITKLASALSVETGEITCWESVCKYAPFSARKARLVTQLIAGRSVQDALDVLKFTNKRAARCVEKVLKTAVADADEQQANVDSLYVSQTRVDEAGIRTGTKRWIAKDRGRAHPIRKKACHVHVVVTEA